MPQKLFRFVSFDPHRSSGIPDTRYIKPEMMYQERQLLQDADYILFPEYWQLNALCYGLKKPVFPNLPTFLMGHDKIEMTRAFWMVRPDATPETRILSNTPVHAEEILDTFYFPFVAKEVRNAQGYGVHLIQNFDDWEQYCGRNDVLYVQEYLPIKRDMRIVWIGDRIVTAYWREARKGCFHNNVSQGGVIRFGNIPQGALDLVEDVARRLEINHAGFDVADVDGFYYLLEFNPRFGLEGVLRQNIELGPIILDYIIRSSRPKSPPKSPPLTPKEVAA
ncbi:MAG: RimK family alpha-L-glutamate ligase [Candidatus Sumerlaeia bacterium]